MKNLIAILICFCSVFLFSQKDTAFSFSNNHFWFGFGAGISAPIPNKTSKPSNNFLNIDCDVNYLYKNKLIFTFGYQGLFASGKSVEYSLDKLQSVLLTYGINRSFGKIHSVIFTTGLSTGSGNYLGQDTSIIVHTLPVGTDSHIPNYIKENYSYYGVYLSAQYLLRTRAYGLGLKFYCNIHKYPDCGIVATHNIGYLNKKRLFM